MKSAINLARTACLWKVLDHGAAEYAAEMFEAVGSKWVVTETKLSE
jgi:hypothetical protein